MAVTTNLNLGGALNETENKNYLSEVGFRFLIQKLPRTEYFVQATSIPAITHNPVIHPNPLTNTMRLPGERLEYETLQLIFRIDEDMSNYIEINDWLTTITSVDDQTKFAAATDRGVVRSMNSDIYSDATLIILNSNQNPLVRINFEDVMPLSLSTVEFDVTQTDITYIQGTAEFAYRRYTIENI